MGRPQKGAIALTAGAIMLSGGVLVASAHEAEGPHEVESPVAAGTLDDGADLLPRAGTSIAEAIAAAQSAAPGPVGEIDLEYVSEILVFNVDVGDQDVQVDAGSGTVRSVDADD